MKFFNYSSRNAIGKSSVAAALLAGALSPLACAAPAAPPQPEPPQPATKSDKRTPKPKKENPLLALYKPRNFPDATGELPSGLPYRLFVPAGYDATKKYPLVLFLHGAGQRGTDNEKQVSGPGPELFASAAVQTPFPAFVVAPQCPLDVETFEIAGRGEAGVTAFSVEPQKGQWHPVQIPIGHYIRGDKKFLTVQMASAIRTSSVEMEIRNVRISQKNAPVQTLDFAALKPVALRAESKITMEIGEGGRSLKLANSDHRPVGVKMELPLVVTENTVVEFDFKSDDPGRTHTLWFNNGERGPFEHKWVQTSWGAEQPHKMAPQPAAPLRLTMEMLDALQKEFSIDAGRIYVSGLSMGGFGTWELLARRPQFFAAAIPICGGADNSTAPVIKDVPIWTFHGDADPVVKVGRTRSMVEALKAAGGAPKYTEYPGVGHSSWHKAYAEPDLVAWLFAQKRNTN